MTGVCIKRGHVDTDTQRRHVKMKAEVGDAATSQEMPGISSKAAQGVGREGGGLEEILVRSPEEPTLSTSSSQTSHLQAVTHISDA